jgi:hypothetical protein
MYTIQTPSNEVSGPTTATAMYVLVALQTIRTLRIVERDSVTHRSSIQYIIIPQQTPTSKNPTETLTASI